jgi:rhamnosyl/mannosyltransferase
MILQVGKYYYPEVGGIEQVVQMLAEGLVKRGQDAEVIAAANTRSSGRESISGVVVRRVATYGTVQSIPIAPGMIATLRRRCKQADVVHYHLPNPLAVAADAIVSPGCPIVITYHSDIVKQSWALSAYRPLLHRLLGRADAIVTTSPRLRDQSKELERHRKKCRVIPLGIDPERFRTRGSRFRSSADEERTVLFVGRLTYYKGVKYLVDAAGEIDGKVLIAGDGPRRNSLEQRAERIPDADIEFLGYVPDEDLAEYYRAADVFVLPSIEPSEAFGIVQLEAMAAGTPVVNTDLESGVPWVSQHGETGLTVPPRDPSALSKAVNRLLSNRALASDCSQAARRRVAQKFTVDGTVEAYEELYRKVR